MHHRFRAVRKRPKDCIKDCSAGKRICRIFRNNFDIILQYLRSLVHMFLVKNARTFSIDPLDSVNFDKIVTGVVPRMSQKQTISTKSCRQIYFGLWINYSIPHEKTCINVENPDLARVCGRFSVDNPVESVDFPALRTMHIHFVIFTRKWTKRKSFQNCANFEETVKRLPRRAFCAREAAFLLALYGRENAALWV